MQNATKTEDTVARRIVMPKRIWEQLVLLTEALEQARDVEVSPLDVAVIALEAGLDEIRRGVSGKARSTKTKSGASSRKKSSSGGQKRKSGSHRRKRPLKLSDDDRAQLEALMLDCRSVRARQRAIALWIGHQKRTIHTEWLRQLALDYDAYNVANFAQNMKKDGAYFLEKRDPQDQRIGWKLTRSGQRHVTAILANSFATA
ncbi:MAG: hypothetical protein JKY65_24200 [Planctomycetes bacterium]|nr:hypothetical protein [Planctomycetota bacterium]